MIGCGNFSRRALLFITLLLVLAMTNTAVVDASVYVAEIAPFGNNPKVSGMVRIFTSNQHPDIIAYYGTVEGVEADLSLEQNGNCTATNGCGVHIHAGYSCETPELQMGHLYNATKLTVDPWLVERYDSDSDGIGRYSGVVDQGTSDIAGRAFVVHNATGGRIGCGILTIDEANVFDNDFFHSYMCPPFSTIRRGVRQLTSFRQCTCLNGFYRQGKTCAADECSGYQCPENSAVMTTVACLSSFRDCACNDGYRKKGGYCMVEEA